MFSHLNFRHININKRILSLFNNVDAGHFILLLLRLLDATAVMHEVSEKQIVI